MPRPSYRGRSSSLETAVPKVSLAAFAPAEVVPHSYQLPLSNKNRATFIDVLPMVLREVPLAVPTLALICSTKGRPSLIERRVPFWCRSGIDLVVIVDASPNPRDCLAAEAVCREHGAVYVRYLPSPRDTRTKQRNLGARRAETDWIVFQDDDDDIIAEFDHAEFDRVAAGVDYIWDGRGVNIVYHRRENFLRLGGYPEDMVQGWLTTLSWLVKATSRGNLEGQLYRRLEPPGGSSETRKMSAQKAAANFWIGFTFMPWLERTPPPQRNKVLAHSVLYFVGLWSERDYRAMAPLGLLIYAVGTVLGVLWHTLRKAIDSGYRGNLHLYRRAFASKPPH